MDFTTNWPEFQRNFKDLKAIMSKSPMLKGDDSKDLSGLLTADSGAGTVQLEMAIKGFWASAVTYTEVKEAGAVAVKVDAICALKSGAKEMGVMTGPKAKVLKLASGRFKADIPAQANTRDISNQRLGSEVGLTHSVATPKLIAALKCINLSTETTQFARFLFDASGLTVWSNDPSSSVLYRNPALSFESPLDIVLPVDFLSTYLSKVSGKLQLGFNSSLFRIKSEDEVDIVHPLRESDIFDIPAHIADLLTQAPTFKFGFKLSEALDSLSSVSSFLPEDGRSTLKVEGFKETCTWRVVGPNGTGENGFPASGLDAGLEGGAILNAAVVLKRLESMRSLGLEEASLWVFPDLVLLRSADGCVTYVCAQMD